MSDIVNTAPIKWAQRADSLYLTIAIPDVKEETIQLSDQELHFKGSSEGKEYQVNIEFYQTVDSEGSTYKVLPRSVQMHVMKKKTTNDNGDNDDDNDDESDFWPRLLKDKTLEKNQVKIDWDRYVEADDADEAGGFDMSALEGGSGMGGMGGMPGGMGGMPGGMGGMGGGMPGMGGGMGGMMGGMGGMGGMASMFGGGGAGGPDMEKLMQQMGQMGAGAEDLGDFDDEDDDDDLDDDDLPDLEEKK